MIPSSYAILSSIISVLIPILERNPCRTLWNIITVFIRVSMVASTTFHITSSSPILRMFTHNLGRRNKMSHTSSTKSMLDYHICWTSFTSFSHSSGLGGIKYFTGYASCSNPWIFSALRRVCHPALFWFTRSIKYSTYTYNSTPSYIWNGKMCIWIGLPGEDGSSCW